MSPTTPRTSTINTLVVFGGETIDLALATDFCAMSRKFGRDGLNPTSLSGTDLFSTVQMFKTLKFGRDDLQRAREEVYTREQASSEGRFYTIVGPGGFKAAIFNWLDGVKARASKGDRIVVVFCAHGAASGCVVLNTQGRKEYLSKTEICTSLTGLVAGTRILLVNEACYSGMWATLAVDVPGKDVLVEAASLIGGVSVNYRSASLLPRCSNFAAAFVHELNVSSEGQIREHTSRIAAEMSHVRETEDTHPPTFAASSRSLWSHNISHFVLTPSIATAIQNVASRQERHEERLSAFQFARNLWRRTHSLPLPTVNADFDSHLIRKHLDLLEETGAGLTTQSGLMAVCVIALRKDASVAVRKQVVQAIAWKERCLMVAEGIIRALLEQELIVRPVEFSAALKLDSSTPLRDQVWDQILNIQLFDIMTSSPLPCRFDFYDAVAWIVEVIAHSWEVSPQTFDLIKVLECVKMTLECARPYLESA